MNHQPQLPEFSEVYDQGRAQVVWTTLVADLETPVSAMIKLAGEEPNSFLLESVEGGAVRGRYSIIGLRPDLVWRCQGDRSEVNRRARFDPNGFEPCDGDPLAALRSLLAESAIDLPAELPPMAAGMVGYFGYDMVRLMERLPASKPVAIEAPDALLIRPTIMAIFDSVKDTVTIVTPVRPESGVNARAAHLRALERLADAVTQFDRPLPHREAAMADCPPIPEPSSNTAPEDFKTMVETAKEYIAAGDIFQVVLSQRFSIPFSLPSFTFYRSLRRLNPSPFMFYLNFGGLAVAGSSPEILVRLRGGKVTIRPLAGTRPRGATPAEDVEIAAGLLADPKECAEHLMLLDLGRNDVGRVAKIGSVKVTERFEIERYSHVMHIVSNVEGEIDPKYDAIDALAGGFPAGTVSGAPKVRAMEIIDELEKEKRGIYAGAVGYFSADGEMDSAIVLRTAIIKDGMLHIQAGAGIVADSDPETELNECRHKARASIRAAEEAVKFASSVGRSQ